MRHLVISGVSVENSQVVVFQINVQKGKDELQQIPITTYQKTRFSKLHYPLPTIGIKT